RGRPSGRPLLFLPCPVPPHKAQVVHSSVMKLRSVKGTNDILPEQQGAWSAIVNAAERVLGNAGAGHITVPIFEYAEVFERSVGESSDIVVQKEMYAFEDRGGRT